MSTKEAELTDNPLHKTLNKKVVNNDSDRDGDSDDENDKSKNDLNNNNTSYTNFDKNKEDDVSKKDGGCSLLKNQYRPMVYMDSEHYQINFKTLFVEFFIQTLFPISFMFTSYSGRKIRSFTLKYPQVYNYHSISLFLIQLTLGYIVPICTLFLLLYTIITGDLTAFVALLLSYMHKLMIALKYATMSDIEYRRLMELENYDVAKIYQNQLQLLTGWLLYNEDIINFDLNRAGDICGGNAELIFFCLPLSQIEVWNKWLTDNGFDPKIAITIPNQSYDASSFDRLKTGIKYYDDETYALVNVKIVCHALVKQCSNLASYFKYCHYCNYMAVYILIARSLYLLQDDGDNGFRIFVKLIKNFVLFIYWPVIFSFIFLGVWDYLRRYHIAIKLNEMILIQGQSLNDNDIKRMDGINQETKKVMGQVKTFFNSFGLQAGSSSDSLNKSNHSTNNSNSTDEEDDLGYVPRATLYADASIYDDDDLPSDWIPNRGKPVLQNDEELDAQKHQFKEGVNKVFESSTLRENTTVGMPKVVFSDNGTNQPLPSVLLDRPMNATAWAYMRQVLVMMGGRYKYRLELFFAVTLGISLVSVIILLLQMLVTQTIDSSHIASKDYFFEIIFMISFILLYSLLVVLIGISVNWEYQVHRDSITSNSMRNETKLSFLMRQAEKVQAIFKMTIIKEKEKEKEKEENEKNSNINTDKDEKNATTLGSLDPTLLDDGMIPHLCLSSSQGSAAVLEDLDARMKRLRDAADYCNRVNYTLMIANETCPLELMGMKCDEGLAVSIATGIISLISTVASIVTNDD